MRFEVFIVVSVKILSCGM